MARRRGFDAFCHDTFGFLSDSNVQYLVIGGLAVVALGEPRVTADVDVVAFVTEEGAVALLDAAIAAGFEAQRAAEVRALGETGTLRLGRGSYRLDVIVASLPFERAALARATRWRMFGRSVPLPTPEDLVVFKLLAARPKDVADAIGVLRRHRGKLDLAYIERALRDVADYAEDPAIVDRLADALRRC